MLQTPTRGWNLFQIRRTCCRKVRGTRFRNFQRKWITTIYVKGEGTAG